MKWIGAKGMGTSLCCQLSSKAPPVTSSWRPASTLPLPQARNLSHTDIPMSPHAFRYQVFLVSVLGFIEFTPIPPPTVATFAQTLSFRCHLEYYSSPLTGLSAHLAPIHSSSMSPGLHSIFILYLNPSASLRDLEDYVPIS